MIRFSKEKVLLLHKLLAEATGGGVGVRDEALLDSALEAAYAGFGEKEFSLDKSELYKTKCNENGTRMFVFKKGIMPSIVDERSFPKAVKMMKDLYCEE